MNDDTEFRAYSFSQMLVQHPGMVAPIVNIDMPNPPEPMPYTVSDLAMDLLFWFLGGLIVTLIIGLYGIVFFILLEALS